jgi:hypothetical protein
LTGELQIISEKNDSLVQTISGLESAIIKLKEENTVLQEQNQQQVPMLEAPGDKDMEIDFLVREIDQCISQIKSNL